MRIYFDSSALTKLYVYEQGSKEALQFCEHASEVVLSCIAIPEFFSALNRRLSDGLLKKKQYTLLKKEFLLDIEEALIIDLSPSIVKTTIQCLEKASLRAFDAIHVASALETHVDLFVSSDHRQIIGAQKMNVEAALI